MAKDRRNVALLGLAAFALASSGSTSPDDPGDGNGDGNGNGDDPGDEPPPNAIPSAEFSHSIEERRDGVYIVVDAGESFDPDGEIVSYQWTHSMYPDGTDVATATGETAEFKIPGTARYYITLRIEDDSGALDQRIQIVDARGYEPLPEPEPGYDSRIRICGKPGSTSAVHYTLSVSGGLREAENSLGPNDTILDDGKTADGLVIGQCDIYEYYGNIVNFDWQEGDLDVYIDGEKKDPYSLPDADGPPQRSWDVLERDRGRDAIHVTVYTTKRLHERNGRKAEKASVNALEGALERSIWDYRIYYNLPLQSATRDTATDRSEDGSYQWWDRQINKNDISPPPVVAKDSNILLTDVPGGGLGAIGGKVCVKGMNTVTTVPEYNVVSKPDTDFGECFGMLHEFAHNLGSTHKDPFGWAANDDAEKVWLRTPGIGGNPTTNKCGEPVPERVHEDVINLMYFHECAYNTAVVSPDSTLIRD